MKSISDKNKITAFLRTVYFILSGVLLLLSYLYKLHFLAGCLICTFLFGITQIRLVFTSRRNEKYQQAQCKFIGFTLILPALGMIANGIGLIFLSGIKLPIYLIITIMAVSAVMIAGLSAHIFVFRKDSSLAAKFLRFTDCAALSAPVSVIVLFALSLSADESAVTIGCMTSVLFGVLTLLIAANMILTSFCGYTTTRESIRIISEMVRGKKLIIFRAVVVKDGFLVVFKLLISIASLSFFMFANALYSVGMGIGRYIAIKMHSRNEEYKLKSYRLVGVVILFSSVCYVLYSIRLFFGGKTTGYPMVIAIAIACYTFIEFTVNIRDIIRLWKSKSLEAKALRALSFSSTLLCFVLTQTAIMSFAHEGDANFFNALSGVIFGGMAAVIGLYIIFSVQRMARK